jgi:predicted membrane chloride channel (bestrophin family)
MNIFKNFFKIVNFQTVIVTILSVIGTFICIKKEWYADLPSGLIGIAIIFPIVFSINAAYKRREEGLKYFSSLKASAIAFHYANRDWITVENSGLQEEANLLIQKLFKVIKEYFTAHPKNEDEKRFYAVYDMFSEFSLFNEKLRAAGVSNSEISRLNQYLRAMIIDFEKMRNIFLYKTPISLRAYSQIFLNLFPILYAPYFAEIGRTSFTIIGYIVAIIYSVVLVSLDNIQEDMENPYDQIGEDDIHLDIVDEYKQVFETK